MSPYHLPDFHAQHQDNVVNLQAGSPGILSANGVYFIMRFIETPIFTRKVVELLDDEDYRSLQLALLLRPELGVVIRKSGGLRKAR